MAVRTETIESSHSIILDKYYMFCSIHILWFCPFLQKWVSWHIPVPSQNNGPKRYYYLHKHVLCACTYIALLCGSITSKVKILIGFYMMKVFIKGHPSLARRYRNSGDVFSLQTKGRMSLHSKTRNRA